MKKIFEWEDGEVVSQGYVLIDGITYPLVMPTYSGKTPISAENLNEMQHIINSNIKEIYSTEEKEIGTWIDGKLLYQKVYTGTVQNATSEILQRNMTNINVIDGTGKVNNSSGTQLIIGYGEGGYGSQIYLYNGDLTLQHTSDIIGDYHVILKYTKNS